MKAAATAAAVVRPAADGGVAVDGRRRQGAGVGGRAVVANTEGIESRKYGTTCKKRGIKRERALKTRHNFVNIHNKSYIYR